MIVRHGLIRYDTIPYKETISGIRKQRKKPKAYCTSHSCTQCNKKGEMKGDSKGLIAIEKPNVSRFSIDCPDCGSALVWSTPEEIGLIIKKL